MSASTAMRVPSPKAIALTGTESNWLRVSFNGLGAAAATGGTGGTGETCMGGAAELVVRGSGATPVRGEVCCAAGGGWATAQATIHRQEAHISAGFIATRELTREWGKPLSIGRAKPSGRVF